MLSAHSLFHMVLKSKRKVSLKAPFTVSLSSRLVAKSTALEPWRSQEADFPKHSSWSEAPPSSFPLSLFLKI
jgi:hypothetical protein